MNIIIGILAIVGIVAIVAAIAAMLWPDGRIIRILLNALAELVCLAATVLKWTIIIALIMYLAAAVKS